MGRRLWEERMKRRVWEGRWVGGYERGEWVGGFAKLEERPRDLVCYLYGSDRGNRCH